MRMCVHTYNKVSLLGKAIGGIFIILLGPTQPSAENSCWRCQQVKKRVPPRIAKPPAAPDTNSSSLLMHTKDDLTILHAVVSASIKVGASWWFEEGYILISSHPPGFSAAPHPRETFASEGETWIAVAGFEKWAIASPGRSWRCLPDQPTNQRGHAVRFQGCCWH